MVVATRSRAEERDRDARHVAGGVPLSRLRSRVKILHIFASTLHSLATIMLWYYRDRSATRCWDRESRAPEVLVPVPTMRFLDGVQLEHFGQLGHASRQHCRRTCLEVELLCFFRFQGEPWPAVVRESWRGRGVWGAPSGRCWHGVAVEPQSHPPHERGKGANRPFGITKKGEALRHHGAVARIWIAMSHLIVRWAISPGVLVASQQGAAAMYALNWNRNRTIGPLKAHVVVGVTAQ